MTLTKTLQAQGITYETFRQQVREQFIISVLRSKNISSPSSFRRTNRTYYVQHRDNFKVEDQVKLRMIVLNRASADDAGTTKKLAEEILAKIEEGASFVDMATIHSEGSQSKQGGDWGWVERSVLRKEIADVAFQLKAGQRSGVMKHLKLTTSCWSKIDAPRIPRAWAKSAKKSKRRSSFRNAPACKRNGLSA